MPVANYPSVVLQEAAVKAAVLLGERHAGIKVDVPVEGIVEQEGALVEVTGAVRADPFAYKRCREVKAAAVVVAQFWKLAFRKEFWLKKYQAPISFQGPSS